MRRYALYLSLLLVLAVVAAGIVWLVSNDAELSRALDENADVDQPGQNAPAEDRLAIGPDAKEFTRADDYGVTDETLANLAAYTGLEEVDIGGCSAVTDTGVAQLGTLRGLRRLDLTKTGAGIKALSAVSALRELEELDLSLCDHVTDEAVAALGVLPKLRVLRLSGCTKLTDRGLAHISKLSSLEVLDLSWCPGFTASGLSSMASSLAGLKDLSLRNTPYTDDVISGLRFGESLGILDLRDMPRLSQGAVVTFRQNHPNCRVIR